MGEWSGFSADPLVASQSLCPRDQNRNIRNTALPSHSLTLSSCAGTMALEKPWQAIATMIAEYSPYLFLSIFLGMAILFAVLPLGLAYLWSKKFSPAKPGKDKSATYECGLESKGDAW